MTQAVPRDALGWGVGDKCGLLETFQVFHFTLAAGFSLL